jgi:hypothetical protein
VSGWTEAEAKTKWCPMARNLVTLDRDGDVFAAASANFFDNNRRTACIGSACMMWRSEGPLEYRYSTRGGSEQFAGEGYQNTGRYTSEHRLIWEKPRAVVRGYCGLAGKP